MVSTQLSVRNQAEASKTVQEIIQAQKQDCGEKTQRIKTRETAETLREN